MKSDSVSDHQRRVRQILEGNERVFFHPFEDLLAVWHGGPQVTIISSRTFEELRVFNVKTAGRNLSEIEDVVSVECCGRGFERPGRRLYTSEVVESENVSGSVEGYRS